MTLKEFANSTTIVSQNIDIQPYYPDIEDYYDVFGFFGYTPLNECLEDDEYMKDFKKYLDWEVVHVRTGISGGESYMFIEVQERQPNLLS